MNPDNKAFLDANRFHYLTLSRAGYIRGLGHETSKRLMQIMGEEFQPGYSADISCSVCVGHMITAIYQRYDRWLAEQPIVVHAGFPSNKEDEPNHL